jgi:hypothetical protein
VKAEDTHIASMGVSVDFAYHLTETIQLATRYDGYNVPASNSNAETLGLNYFLSGHHSEIQLSVSRLSDMTSDQGITRPAPGLGGTLLIIAFQAAI